jgi:hypothetical protein
MPDARHTRCMSSEEPSDRQKEILRRLDPKGEFEELTRLFAPLVETQAGQELLRLAGISPDRFLGPLRDAQGIAHRMAQAVALFVPLGWAPSSSLPSPPYEEALTVLAKTESTDTAEAVLVAGWNEKDRLLWAIKPVSGLGRPKVDLSASFHRRSVLIHKALSHHQSGAYEASVPIVLAQIDGIVWDLTTPATGLYRKGPGRSSGRRNNHRRLARRPEASESPLRAGHAKTASTGQLTRHGILHGRELGYDTKINSTKVFVLLLAVIEWAMGQRRIVF